MKKRALLIGINKYQTLGKLSFARQDAEAFAESLCHNYGFFSHDINLMTCQTEGAGAAFSRYVELAISDLVEYKGLDLLVFGFWGHGFAPEAGKRYLCGLDTIVDDLERTAVSMDLIKSKLSQVGAENTLLVLDCCQNKPTGRSVETETLSRGEEAELSSLARDIQVARREESKLTVPTVAVLNSCREGQRAYEWTQREHGIFTAHLLDQMVVGVSSVAQLASSIFDPVTQTAMNLHRQKQTPFVVIEGKGDITILGTNTANKSKKTNVASKNKQVVKSSPPSKAKIESKQASKVSPVSPPKGIRPIQSESSCWWVVVNGQEQGPLDENYVKALISQGKVFRDTECWQNGWDKWLPIEKVEQWRSLFPPKRSYNTAKSTNKKPSNKQLENDCHVVVCVGEETFLIEEKQHTKCSDNNAPYVLENLEKWQNAAEFGIPDGMFLLGNNILGFKELSDRYEEGLLWLEKAAHAGHVPAKRELGRKLVESGKTMEGIKYLQEAIDCDDPNACYSFAFCFREGKGVNKSRQEFWYWMKKAANFGHDMARLNVEMMESGALDTFDLDDE